MCPFFMAERVSVLSGRQPFRLAELEGVLLGFWQGNKLKDDDGYLTHDTNKQIFYKIFKSAEEIDEPAIVKLLNEAVRIDRQHSKLSIMVSVGGDTDRGGEIFKSAEEIDETAIVKLLNETVRIDGLFV